MNKTIVGYFDQYTQAQAAVRSLVDTGFSRNDISLVAGDPTGEYAKSGGISSTDPDATSYTAAGAGTGAVLGGLGGLLVGIGVLAIPGVGPVIAAGPLATTLLGAGVGAAAGGLIGILMDAGIPEDEAHYYAEGLRRGGAVVTVSTQDEMLVDRATNIFERHGAVDIDRRADEWRQTGWTGYSPNTSSTATTKPLNEYRRISDFGTYDDYATDFRNNFSTTYGFRGYTYDRYEPAYRYGYTLATDRRYTNKDWLAFEDDARREWEKNYQGSKWEDFKESIRYAWERVKGYSPMEATARAESNRSSTDAFDNYSNDFRSNFANNYANRGYSYDRYEPAYRYGYMLANDKRYTGKDWSAIEADARRDWERNNQGLWEDFKDSIRYAWDRVRGYSAEEATARSNKRNAA